MLGLLAGILFHSSVTAIGRSVSSFATYVHLARIVPQSLVDVLPAGLARDSFIDFVALIFYSILPRKAGISSHFFFKKPRQDLSSITVPVSLATWEQHISTEHENECHALVVHPPEYWINSLLDHLASPSTGEKHVSKNQLLFA